MDFPIIIIWVSPLSISGVLGVNLIFYSIFSMKYLQAKRIAPDGTPQNAASHLGLCCLPLSHKKGTPGLNELKHAVSTSYDKRFKVLFV